MKTDVEELSPTRVKLTVEVPFAELKQNLDQVYREVSRQIRVPGFRPGRVPPRVIDQRVGRPAVLEQAINEAMPQLLIKALDEHEIVGLGQPDYDVTKLDDGKELVFTGELDRRPAFELPDLDGIPVTVESTEVTPDQVEEYLGSLRERFASLKGVDRAVADGDFVSIDLAASVDGKAVEDAQASGISYEVGTGSMLDGLDEALAGMSAGETKTFTAELAGGQLAGMEADVQVTVNSVKVKELPPLDDDFAQSASEFDTIGELRAGTRKQLEAMRRSGQAGQARERTLDAVLERVDMPLPERIIDEEIEQRRHSLNDRLQRAGMTMDNYLEGSGQTAAAIEEEFASDARRSVKAGFILDRIATDEKIGIESAELDAYVTQQAYQMGVAPQQLAKQLTDSGQLSHVVSDVLRSKALTLMTERATVTDEAGHPVDVAAAIRGEDGEEDEASDEAAGTEAAGDEAAGDEAQAAEAAEAPARRRTRAAKTREPKEAPEDGDKPAKAPRARRAKAKQTDAETTETDASADQA
ncbi:MAG TPA: trigger factor [Streptosporangiaceae bacterium]|nr:trigger factor [Streptosporangiaceae bacterium]